MDASTSTRNKKPDEGSHRAVIHSAARHDAEFLLEVMSQTPRVGGRIDWIKVHKTWVRSSKAHQERSQKALKAMYGRLLKAESAIGERARGLHVSRPGKLTSEQLKRNAAQREVARRQKKQAHILLRERHFVQSQLTGFTEHAEEVPHHVTQLSEHVSELSLALAEQRMSQEEMKELIRTIKNKKFTFGRSGKDIIQIASPGVTLEDLARDSSVLHLYVGFTSAESGSAAYAKESTRQLKEVVKKGVSIEINRAVIFDVVTVDSLDDAASNDSPCIEQSLQQYLLRIAPEKCRFTANYRRGGRKKTTEEKQRIEEYAAVLISNPAFTNIDEAREEANLIVEKERKLARRGSVFLTVVKEGSTENA